MDLRDYSGRIMDGRDVLAYQLGSHGSHGSGMDPWIYTVQ